MKGFTDKALILMPHEDCYNYKDDEYYRLLHRALDNIIAFCKTNGMTPEMLMSDTVAMLENRKDVTWVQTMTPGDFIFAKAHCDNVHDQPNTVKLKDIYKRVLAKYPAGDPSKVEDYFQSMLKRIHRIEKEYMGTSKCIFSIQTQNHCAYNVKPTEGMERIIIKVNNSNFMPNTYIGAMEINPIELLGFPTANMPVIDWRVS